MSPIIDLQRRLTEVGRIRMGKKGDRGQPQKLDTWRLTSRDRERLDAVAAQHGGIVQPWADREGEYEVVTTTAELPIMLLPGQTLSQWHELWSGGGCLRRCDGEREILSDSACVCDGEPGDRKCKPTTRLSVMLPDIPGLGCWRLESHGYYAAVELSATAHMLEQATARGQLLPARLRIDQRSQIKDGKTTRYAVPVIDIDITMREALPLASGGNGGEVGYTPARRAIGAVTVSDGLAAAAASGNPTAVSGRAAAAIPAGDALEFGPAPVPVDDPAVAAPAATEKPATAPMRKKLDVLVGQLRDGGHITTEQLWAALAKERNIDVEIMVGALGGRDSEGVVHWAPLRGSLTKDEAHGLIDRLTRLQENVAAGGFRVPASVAQANQQETM